MILPNVHTFTTTKDVLDLYTNFTHLLSGIVDWVYLFEFFKYDEMETFFHIKSQQFGGSVPQRWLCIIHI